MTSMRSSFRGRAVVLTGALLAVLALPTSVPAEHSLLEQVSTGPTGGNGAFTPFFVGASADGSRVYFATSEALVSGDTDTSRDIYAHSGSQTTLVSTGPTGENGAFDAGEIRVSADGSHVFFETFESLVSADTDTRQDVYDWSDGQTTLVSTGPAGGNGAPNAFLRGQAVSADGSRVFFETLEPLVSGDTDPANDVYERSNGQTTLVSTGSTGGNADSPAQFRATSSDGSRVFFSTFESLVSTDTDTRQDIYERAGAQTTLLSTGPGGGNGAISADLPAATVSTDASRGVSADGSRVVFVTSESLVSADTDTRVDLYQRAGGQTTLVSTGPAGGNGAFDPFFRGISADGSRVFFITLEPLVSGDTDAGFDLYEWSGGQTTLLSTGPAGGNGALGSAEFAGASADGSRVFFLTFESLVSADTDTSRDLYERSAGQTTLLSTGPAGGNGAFDLALTVVVSADGSRVFFFTNESLVSADTDTVSDVYERSAGQTTLISNGPAGGNGAFGASLIRGGVSADGSRIFFQTTEPLLSGDSDASPDLYVKRFAPSTPAPQNTAPPAISGSAVAGQTLTCSQGSWTNNPTSFAYRWNRDAAAITDAMASTYTIAGGDVARQITCTVTASNAGGSTAATTAPVTPSQVPVAVALPQNTAPPSISGSAVAGQPLTCSQGSWTNNPTSFLYFWSRDDTAIVGATSPTYTVTDGDVAHQIRCTVAASNAGGINAATSVPVTPTATISAPPTLSAPLVTPTIDGDRDRDGIADSLDTSDASAGPTLAKTVVAQVISGEVFVRRPSSSSQTPSTSGVPKGFVAIKGAEIIPVASILDSTRGRLVLTSVAEVVSGRPQTQKATFYGGIFHVKQNAERKPITELTLRGNFDQVCAKTAGARSSGRPGGTAAQRRRSSRRVSRLWSDGRGRFRTKGRRSAATTSAATWLTEERCDGTLTRVRRGTVTVRDAVARRTITLRAGRSYLARANRTSRRRQER